MLISVELNAPWLSGLCALTDRRNETDFSVRLEGDTYPVFFLGSGKVAWLGCFSYWLLSQGRNKGMTYGNWSKVVTRVKFASLLGQLSMNIAGDSKILMILLISTLDVTLYNQ